MMKKNTRFCTVCALLILALFSGCATTSQFPFGPGVYKEGHPQERAFWDAIYKASVWVFLSGPSEIGLPWQTKGGGANDITIEELRARLQMIPGRQQAIIHEDPSFTNQKRVEEKVVALLSELGFKTVIVKTWHENDAMIKKVINN
jgi:hypothetical protein